MFYRKIILLLLTIVSSTIFSQSSINQDLKKELDVIMRSDQKLRELFDNQTKPARRQETIKEYNLTDEQANSWNTVAKQDKINLLKIENIIHQYGYPGKSLVGEPTNKSAFYVLQHSDEKTLKKYLPILKKAAKTGELPFKYYAMMLDRCLMNDRKPQIYGTQGFGSYWLNDVSGKEEWIEFIWPIKNLKKVNSLRKKAGFKTTFEEYAIDLYGGDYLMIPLKKAIKISNYQKKWD